MLSKVLYFDPRVYQISTLSILLAYGLFFLHFDISTSIVALLISTALATQWLCSKITKVKFEPKSALISALSLCLLLRANSVWLYVLGAVLAISSKFFIRIRGKHVFNPTNIAIVILLLTTNSVWVSPGQWGTAAWFAFLMACAGALVVNRAVRGDVTYAFIAFFVGLLFYRAWILGDPWSIPLHKLQSGSLVLFAFFMISDPRTTPDRRLGRMIFAFLVAWIGWLIQIKLFRSEGLLFSLAAVSLLTPLIDLLLPADRYQWGARPRPPAKEKPLENLIALPVRSTL